MRCTACNSENVFLSGDFNLEIFDCEDCGEHWEHDHEYDREMGRIVEEESIREWEEEGWSEMIHQALEDEKERKLANS